MKLQENNLNGLWGSLLIEELVRNGLDFFCLAPGSRCAPLTVAVASHPKARNVRHYDERGAAFHALGYGRATGRPAVLITTSGTAVANVWPAVVEASVDRIPLILLTADRPPELRDTGANQTIHQAGFFGPYVRWQMDLPCPEKSFAPATLLTIVDQAIYRSLRSPKGPVHINCMFREPLDPVRSGEDFAGYLAGIASWLAGDGPYTQYSFPSPEPDPGSFDQLTAALNNVERGLLVVGSVGGLEHCDAVVNFAEKLSWPMLADVTSGLRLAGPYDPMAPYYDALLASPRFSEGDRAEAVLHLGGRIISKRLANYLERIRPCPYILVDDHPLRQDPQHRVTLRIESEVKSFCEILTPRIKVRDGSAWLTRWQKASDCVRHTVDAFVGNSLVLNEPLVARLLSQMIQPDHGLFLAASMPMRDMDTYAVVNGMRTAVGCNRGASGIDGVLATATGFARGLNRPLTVLMGDLAFLHDLNSLNLLRQIDVPLTVVVLNNGGGGIFSFLPIAWFPDIFEDFFGTPHDLTFEKAAQMFGVEYARPSTKEAFIDAYRKAVEGDRPTLIEIKTDRKENHELHQNLLQEVVSGLNQA